MIQSICCAQVDTGEDYDSRMYHMGCPVNMSDINILTMNRIEKGSISIYNLKGIMKF